MAKPEQNAIDQMWDAFDRMFDGVSKGFRHVDKALGLLEKVGAEPNAPQEIRITLTPSMLSNLEAGRKQTFKTGTLLITLATQPKGVSH